MDTRDLGSDFLFFFDHGEKILMAVMKTVTQYTDLI